LIGLVEGGGMKWDGIKFHCLDI